MITPHPTPIPTPTPWWMLLLMMPEPEALLKHGKLACALLKMGRKRARQKGKEHRRSLNANL